MVATQPCRGRPGATRPRGTCLRWLPSGHVESGDRPVVAVRHDAGAVRARRCRARCGRLPTASRRPTRIACRSPTEPWRTLVLGRLKVETTFDTWTATARLGGAIPAGETVESYVDGGARGTKEECTTIATFVEEFDVAAEDHSSHDAAPHVRPGGHDRPLRSGARSASRSRCGGGRDRERRAGRDHGVGRGGRCDHRRGGERLGSTRWASRRPPNLIRRLASRLLPRRRRERGLLAVRHLRKERCPKASHVHHQRGCSGVCTPSGARP